MNIPDFMPKLRRGAGPTPKDGGCLVQVASYLYDGESWTDRTPCVHPMLREVAIGVNDSVSDHARQGLLEFAPRLIGTRNDDRALERRLVLWCAGYARQFETGLRRDAYQRYVRSYRGYDESWPYNSARDVAGSVLREVYEGVVQGARRDVDPSFFGSITPMENRMIYDEADAAIILFLEDMINEFDRITGRKITGKTVTEEDWKRVRDHMRTNA